MGIWSQLETIINGYVNNMVGGKPEGRTFSRKYSGDPDLDAAYDELNDFLNNKETHNSKNEYTWQDAKSAQYSNYSLPPEELRADFETLGVPFGADAETCKAAYKKLLKIHHPDRHAGHEGNFKKATAKSAKINAAWDRIEKLWIQQ